MTVRGGFSLLQVILVGVILAVVGMSMAPRFSSAASDARTADLCESLQNVRRHIEVYRREHQGGLPVPAGGSGEEFVRCMTEADGPACDGSAPRLERMPVNPYNRLDAVRVGGAPAGAGTHGWRFDPLTGAFQADDSHDAGGDGLPEHASL